MCVFLYSTTMRGKCMSNFINSYGKDSKYLNCSNFKQITRKQLSPSSVGKTMKYHFFLQFGTSR